MSLDILTDALELQRLRRRLPNPARRRLLREQHGLSQQAVADAVGVDRASVSRWEGGEREPRDRHLPKYVAVLDRLADEAKAS